MLRTLLLEDDSVDAEIVTRALKKTYTRTDVTKITSLGVALRELHENEYDLILSDLGLADCMGVDSVIQLNQARPECPIIVLTGLEDEQVAIRAIAEGAQDYLIKDELTPELLERAITYAVQRHRLLRKNHELIASVQEGQAMLEAKNRKLQKACETAQQFVDHVSHEFRTPLTVIMEYASLLQESIAGPVNEAQANLLKIIDDRAGDLNNMVDDMLDVSQLESGLLNAARSRSDVSEIVEHVMPSLERKAEIRGVELNIDIEHDLPAVFCDAEKAGRVIINLAVNAIKFSGEPGRVTIWARSLGTSDVQIGVRDNGVGIPETRREEIFHRFSQIKTGLANGVKGFGLGLNIAKELVDLNLGQMGLESVEGEGSTFTFTLPVDQPSEVACRFMTRLAAAPSEVPSVSLFEASIDPACVERDHEDVDRFLKHILRQNDLVFPCGNGTWLLLVSVPVSESNTFVNRLQNCLAEANRNRSHHAVPELTLLNKGSWNLGSTNDAVIERLAENLSTETPACV